MEFPMTITRFLILFLFSGYALADEKSCFADKRIHQGDSIVFKDVVNNNIFDRLDSASLSTELQLKYPKNSSHEKNIHDNSMQQREVFVADGLYVEQIKSPKHKKINTLCAEIQNKQIIQKFINNDELLESIVPEECSTECEIRFSSYDENSLMYALIKDRKIYRIKYINVGYDG